MDKSNTYAHTCWSPGDVVSTAKEEGRDMTEDEAETFLSENEKYIEEACVSAGCDAIRALL